MTQVKINRRIHEPKKFEGFRKTQELCEMVRRTKASVWVRLKNGDIIKRKVKDVEEVTC